MSADSPKRRTQPAQRPSTLGQMVGILVGGALGIVMGYWLLNLIGGPKYNFLQVSLPFVGEVEPAPGAQPQSQEIKRPAVQEAPMPRRPQETVSTPVAHAPGSPDVIEPRVDAALPYSFPRYSSDELTQALAAANTMAGCENCQSTGFIKPRVPCPVCGGKPSGRITAEVYATYCRLAEVVTFVEVKPVDPQFVRCKEALEQLFLRAAADREKQAALGRMASHHLKNLHPSTNGILLAGTVQEIGQAGDYHSVRLMLFGLGEDVMVVSDSPVRAKLQSRVLLAGSIIDRPRERLAGYRGTAAQVVLGGFPLALPADGR